MSERAAAPPRTAPVLVLVGPPGAGKTTVGGRLAERLGRTLRDTDADVERVAGASVAEIFVDSGEQQFRALEAEAVAAALREHRGVLALGGGAVLAAETRTALRGHRVIFLDVGLAQAARRVGLGAARPLLLGNVRGRLKTLLDERRPLYLDVATAQVLTDDLAVDEVVDRVAVLLTAAGEPAAATGPS
ncbi:MAG: shikimate kinase [Nocardioidaceae bacterium]